MCMLHSLRLLIVKKWGYLCSYSFFSFGLMYALEYKKSVSQEQITKGQIQIDELMGIIKMQSNSSNEGEQMIKKTDENELANVLI